jgi:hypothetical protein
LNNVAPLDIRNQGRPLKRLLEEWGRRRPAMAYFPESYMMMMIMATISVAECSVNCAVICL